MTTNKNLYIVTTSEGKQVELTTAKVLKSNNLYPFGMHNYAIYETPEGLFVKATNSGEREIMLTDYALIDEAAARTYDHPYYRVDE
ncbi:hypothetical protein [Pontibacter vulgaris]|uniref:hypothetical protein n=1 Tax=Pontibacter vulgaris TaxID=2905679 RepID=UPI001FA7CB53|nr:hypothetical protein [Pontibacter vulgaris]